MSPRPSPSHDPHGSERAAEWVLRHDRGITPAEQDEFSQWLAKDPRHPAAFAEQRAAWNALEQLAGLPSADRSHFPDPDLLAPARTRRRLAWFPTVALAAAAAVAVGLFVWPRGHAPSYAAASAPALVAPLEERTLPDGSTISINRGGIVTEHFTPTERRIRLEHGEAHFSVAHDTSRPFIVEAGGVAVRAVGTAFNVRMGDEAIEVLVTEGKVGVADTARGDSLLAPSPNHEPAVLVAGQQAIVTRESQGTAAVATLSAEEVEQRLLWQRRLLDFTDTPLSQIVAEFNRRNPVRLSLDPSIEDMRLSATFRSDNVEGFIRLLESDFGLRSQWRSGTEIVLSRAR